MGMDLARDAAELRRMATRIDEIARHIEPHIKSETREDLAFNVKAVVGGSAGSVNRAASWIEELDRSLRL